jgi:hypothetical protein
MIDMLAIMSSWLDKYPDVCIEFPKDVTTQQAVRVIVRYIEAHPERMRDSFHLLAIDNAWPCGASSDSNNRFYAK